MNASFGQFSAAVAKASTKALEGDDATYASIEGSISDLTTKRDTLAASIRSAFDGAAFDNQPISSSQAQSWIDQANALIAQAQALS